MEDERNAEGVRASFHAEEAMCMAILLKAAEQMHMLGIRPDASTAALMAMAARAAGCLPVHDEAAYHAELGPQFSNAAKECRKDFNARYKTGEKDDG